MDKPVLGAIDEQGVYVLPSLLTQSELNLLRKRSFYCPECKNEVIFRAGPTVIPHFAHKRDVRCQTGSRGGEGKLHYEGKLSLYRWLQTLRYNPQLEKYLPDINQRPDLYVEINKRKIALEYQRATITHKEIKARNIGYNQVRMLIIWVLGENLLRKLTTFSYRVPSFTKEILEPHFSNHPLRLIFFSPLDQRLITLSDIYFVNQSKVIALSSAKSLRDASLKDLFIERTISKKLLYDLWFFEKKRFRLSNIRVKGKEFQFRKWLYHQNLHVEQLPSFIHLPIRLQYKINIPLWHWQTYLVVKVIAPTPLNKSFSLDQCIHVLSPYANNSNRKELKQIIVEYLSYFEQLNTIVRISEARWKKINKIHFYRNIEEAVKGDQLLLNMLKKN